MTQVTKNKTAFKIGDKVSFLIENPDVHANYPEHFITEYGVVTRINKVTMVIEAVNGLKHVEKMSNVKPYIDPFANIK